MPARTVASSGTNAQSRKKSGRRAAVEDAAETREDPSTTLRIKVCSIFGDAQHSVNTHRKLVVSLRKVQEACCYEPTQTQKNAMGEEFDENDFAQEIARCVLRILPIRKGEGVGDKVVKFLGLFLKHATDLDNDIFREASTDELEGFPETPTSRLTSYIMTNLIPLLQAKDRVVRFRSTQIIAYLVNNLDSVDDEIFPHIRLGLLKRLRDKESSVRVQAVYGLGRLAGEATDDNDDDSEDETNGGILEKLLDILQNDPSADVRRALLLNLPFTPSTLPYLLERARDLDGSIRKALYARLLPALGDFRHLSLTHREKLLRWGLRDRDEHVRAATARLFRERWIEDCARPRSDNPDELKPGQLAPPSTEGLLELLERIDVVNAGNDGGIALDAMRDFWEGRRDYRNHVVFDEAFWKDLTPESVFIARTFNDFCRRGDGSDGLEEKMPEVTRFAYLVQRNINLLVEHVHAIAVQEDAQEDSIQQEFIVEQLLQIALTLDFSDEVGRRTMYSLMREALTLTELPEETTRLVTEVLRMVCGTNANSEQDFCAIVLEAIAEIHDTIMGDEAKPANTDEDDAEDSFHSARSEISVESAATVRPTAEDDEEKLVREVMVNMKCLHVAQCMLQNVEGALQQNLSLVTMLNNLVVPAVRSQEAPIRERGILCLGLCCLLDKNLAEENLTLFLHCFNKGHEALQNIVLQIIGDILQAHSSFTTVVDSSEDASEVQSALHKPILKLFNKALKSPSPLIQSTACTALCKLMLASPDVGATSILNGDELLRDITIAYFDPETAGNATLRQSLSYFLPVYCHSRHSNMQRMGRIALGVLGWCLSIKEELEMDGDVEAESASGGMVGLAVVVAHLSDWTDGRKLAAAAASGVSDEKEVDTGVHLELAEEILDKVLGVCSKEERKLMMSLLGKLYITTNPSTDAAKLESVTRLLEEAVDDKIANDVATRNALNKLQTTLTKAAEQSERERRPSIAASEAPSEALSGIDEDDDAATMMTEPGTPAPSPRKARPSPRKRVQPSKRPQPVLETADPFIDESTLTTPAASPQKAPRARQPPPARAPNPPAPAVRHEAAADAGADADGDTEMTDITEATEHSTLAPPTPAARRSPRKAAPVRRQTAPARAAPAPAIVGRAEESEDELHSMHGGGGGGDGESTLVRVKREGSVAAMPPPPRPDKAGSATATAARGGARAATARRSVRAGRRRTVDVDGDEDASLLA